MLRGPPAKFPTPGMTTTEYGAPVRGLLPPVNRNDFAAFAISAFGLVNAFWLSTTEVCMPKRASLIRFGLSVEVPFTVQICGRRRTKPFNVLVVQEVPVASQ